MGYPIREAEGKDALAILAYLKVVGSETDNLLFGAEGLAMAINQEKEWLEKARESKKDVILLAEAGDEIIGMASIAGLKNQRLAHRASFAVTVKKSYWSQGIGQKLLKECIEFAQKVGYHLIELEVRADNLGAIRLYEQFGFQTWGRYKDYFAINGQFYDALCMTLYL